MTDVILTHGRLTLRPLTPDDAPALRSIVDAQMWAGMSAPLPADDDAMRAHLDELLATPGVTAFGVEWEGEFVGRTTYYDLVPGVRVDIGHTIYARPVWGTEVNPTAKFLLFRQAFDEWGLRRVALRCDHRNARSHHAIARLGARFEGTLRHFRYAADGSLVDVDYFSVTDDEWPEVREGLAARIDRAR